MKRTLQKHGKIILTILGVVLMITFALPSFSGGNRDTSGDAVGRLNGRKVTHNDLLAAQYELQMLRAFDQGSAIQFVMVDERDDIQALYWYLLVQEATKYGFDPGMMGDDQIVQMLAGRFSPTDIAVKTNQNIKGLARAIQHLQMIQSLQGFTIMMPQPIAAVELVADQQMTKAQVGWVTIDGAKGWETMPAPTEEQVKKQFDLYKGQVRATASNSMFSAPPLPPEVNGHHFPFGYKYPDRVKLEYLAFNRAALKQIIKPTADDDIEAYKYFREHPTEAKAFAAVPSTAASQPGTAPAVTFESVKQALVNRQVDLRITRLIRKVADRAAARAGEAWKNVAIDDKGYRTAVAADAWANYGTIADEISKNREFEGYSPQYKKVDTFLSAEGLEALEGIGKAGFAMNERYEFSFPELATSVHELVTLPPRDPKEGLKLQVGTENRLLTDGDGNLYLFRVTAAEKSHEPAAVDEVRGQVVEDLKKLAAYEKAQADAKALAAAAKGGDLVKLAEEKKLTAEKSPEFSKMDREMPMQIRAIPGFVEATFAMVPGGTAAGSQPASAPATGPAASQPATGVGATTTLDNEAALKVYVLKLENVRHVRPDEFAKGRGNLAMGNVTELQLFAQKWFSLDEVIKRTGYKPNVPIERKSPEE